MDAFKICIAFSFIFSSSAFAAAVSMGSFSKNIKRLENSTLEKREEAADSVKTQWDEITAQVTDAKSAEKLAKQLSLLPLRSELLFIPSLHLITDFNAKGYNAAATQVSKWFSKSYKQPPKENLNMSVRELTLAGRTLRFSKPWPLDITRDLALTASGWFNEKFVKNLDPEKTFDLVEILVPMLHFVGRSDVIFAFSQYISDDVLKHNVQGATTLVQDVCVYGRTWGKLKSCEDLIDRTQKLADAQNIKVFNLELERARVLLEKGEFDQARNMIKKLIAQIPENDPHARMLIWLNFELAQMELSLGNVAEAEKYIAEHWRLLQAVRIERAPLVADIERSPMLMLQTEILIRSGKFEEAATKMKDIEESIRKEFQGTQTIESGLALYRFQIACIQRDKVKIQQEFLAARKLYDRFPDMKMHLPFMNALKKASNGTFKDSDLDPIIKVVGPKSILVENFKRMIEVVKSTKPVKLDRRKT